MGSACQQSVIRQLSPQALSASTTYRNPLNTSGVNRRFVVNRLSLVFDVKLTNALASTFRISDETDMNSLLDGICAAITVQSKSLPNLVNSLSLAQLRRCIVGSDGNFDNARFGLPAFNQQLLTALGVIDLRVSIPVELEFPLIGDLRGLFRQSWASLADGGSIVARYGALTATTGGTAWVITGTFAVDVEGYYSDTMRNAAPLEFFREQQNNRDNYELTREGAYLFAGIDVQAGSSTWASGQIQMDVDGARLYTYSDTDPKKLCQTFVSDNPGYGAAGTGFKWDDLPFIPLISTPRNATIFDVGAFSGAALKVGSDFANSEYLIGVRAIPVSADARPFDMKAARKADGTGRVSSQAIQADRPDLVKYIAEVEAG